MRYKIQGTCRDEVGGIIASGLVSVYASGTSTPASIYATATSSTVVNSVTADSSGNFSFYYEEGDYYGDHTRKIVISKAGYTTSTYDYHGPSDFVIGDFTNANITLALTAIGSSTGATLFLRPGTWVISADLTIPSNITLELPNGAVMQIATGKTLTINGSFKAGLYQVFDCVGTGKVSFPYTVSDSKCRTVAVIPQWFGNTGDSTSYTDHTPIGKAIEAAGYYGTIEYYGVYYCGAGITSGHVQKHIGRWSPDPYRGTVGAYWFAGTASLVFDMAAGAAFTCAVGTCIKDINIYFTTVGGLTVGVLCDGSTGGIPGASCEVDRVNVSHAFVGYSIKETWHSSLSNSYIQPVGSVAAPGIGILVDYCYALDLYNVQIGSFGIGLYIDASSHPSVVNVMHCTFETVYEMPLPSIAACIYVTSTSDIYRSMVNVHNSYFECHLTSAELGYCILLDDNAGVNIIGCHAYLTNTSAFVCASGKTDVHLVSKNNIFRFQDTADTATRYAYILPSTGFVDISGDNWHVTGPGMHYLSSYSFESGFNITLPWNLVNNRYPVHAIGFPLQLQSGITGKVTLRNAAYTDVVSVKPTPLSQIMISPNNAAAATLQAGSSAIYPSKIYELLLLQNAPDNTFVVGNIVLVGTATAIVTSVKSAQSYIIEQRVGEFVVGTDVYGGYDAAPYVSDFTAGEDNWLESNTTADGNIDAHGYTDTLRSYATNAGVTHAIYRSIAITAPVTSYIISFEYYIPSANTHLKRIGLPASTNTGLGTDGQASAIGDTVDAWTSITAFVTHDLAGGAFPIVMGSSDGWSFTGANSVLDDLLYIKNVTIETANVSESTTSDYPSVKGYGFRLSTADSGNAVGTEEFNYLIIN